jgi:hypothetical protein
MKAVKAATGLFLIAMLVICFEVFAGITILKNGHLLDGKVLSDDGDVLILGYRYGTLSVSNRFVERTVTAPEESEYGSQLFPPSNDEMYRLESMFFQVANPADLLKPKLSDKDKHTTLMRKFRTVHHSIETDGWELSLKLPASFEKSGDKDFLVFSSPGGKSCPTVCMAVVETLPVELAKQIELTEAVATAHLGGFAQVYSVTRQTVKNGTGECVLLGTYGPGNSQTITQTILRRTPSSTFVVCFFLPRAMYEEYRALFSACQDSIRLKETEK